jgi:dolichyl-phosphate-mannose--protein O-mannosyl transferase
LGWWGGISDLFHYYGDVVNYENSVSTATHPYASPWWSWPLMLRPVAYWQNFPARGGPVATIWGAGNPLTWWTVIPAMTVTMVRAIERPSVTRSFIVIGFLAYYLMWIPIGRILFLYHYMPSVYLGYLALGGLLADLWAARAELWESLALLTALCMAIFVGFYQYAAVYNLMAAPIWAGVPLMVILGIGFGALIRRPAAHRYVAAVFIAATVIAFVYFAPVWLGIPIARKGYYARMWLEGPGLRNWI